MDTEILKTIQITIPLWQISLFLLLAAILMLMGHKKIALATCYAFSLYWIFGLNRPELLKQFSNSTLLMGIYLAAGIIVVFLLLITFLIKE